MLWRFSFATTSNIDTLLTREMPPSVEELMDEQEVLNECKAMNIKLVEYLNKPDAIKSLLQWVVAGLDELDQEAALADSTSFDHAVLSPALFPAFQATMPTPEPVPGPGPDSPPLEPAKMADDGLTVHSSPSGGLGIDLPSEGLSRQQSRDNEASRTRYSHIATEILTSEVWTIPETALAHGATVMAPFWDAVLPLNEPTTPSTEDGSMSQSLLELSERQRAIEGFWTDVDEERDRKREIIRGYWTRVNGEFLKKQGPQMMKFIQTLPNVVDRLLAQIASPAIQDMLVRIISTEEAGVPGVIDWLSEGGLVPKLIAMLSPHHNPTLQSTACELLKSIISLCAPTAFNPNGGNNMQTPGQANTPGVRDNKLIRELVSEASISTMVGFMLDDVRPTDQDWKGMNDGESFHPADPFVTHPLPSMASCSSSLVHICNIFVELIRRNNSDFSEPHLFHTLRQKLMNIQMQEQKMTSGENKEEENRKEMEEAMVDLTEKMGIVHLGQLTGIIADRFEEIHRIFTKPRSEDRVGSWSTGKPLTLERFRIVELYAELLHSSNMSVLNRPVNTGPEYTADGILSGGLAGLEALGEAIDGDRVGEGEEDATPEAQVTQARELPVSSGSTDCSLTGSEEVGSDDEGILSQSDDDATPSQSPAASTTLPPAPRPDVRSPTPPPTSQEDAERLRDVRDMDAPAVANSVISDMESVSHAAVATTTVAPSVVSEGTEYRPSDATPKDDRLPPGDRLKQMYIQHGVLPAVVDMFFDYPQNDFMRHVVYDLLQQILNGRLGPGLNRELVIELIRGGKLIERILDAQKLNDQMIKQPRTARMPYMGHLSLIADELVKFLARCPPELLEVISDSYNHSEWESFAEGILSETRDRNSKPLAGGKPMMSMSAAEALAKESEDSSSDEEDMSNEEHKFGEPLSRTTAKEGFATRQGFETYSDRDNADDDEYWRQSSSRRHVDSSDEDDDDADWMRPSSSSYPRRNSDDEDFGGFQTSNAGGMSDDLDDDGWGNFHSPNSADDPDNPFGDDNFTPSVANPTVVARPAPLTPHDWASEFDREFAEENMPNIVVPEDEGDEDEGYVSGGASSTGWTFTGREDQAEDLPPTESPTFEEVEIFDAPQRAESAEGPQGLEKLHISSPEAASSSHSASPSTSPVTMPISPITIPHRLSGTADLTALSPARRRSSVSSTSSEDATKGDAYSPPDPALIAAATEDAPLGPGVSPDTHVTEDGMLEKEINGEKIVVPADEVARSVEEAMESRHS